MGITIHEVPNKSRISALAADMIATGLLEDFHQHNQASLMLSGGSTPGPVYQNLAMRDLPWANIDVGLVDERWVDETDPGSNARLIKETLLTHHGRAANFYPMKSLDLTAEAGQGTIETAYRAINQPYSFTVLGMGPDGHTASWFPDATGLDEAVNPDNENCVQAITAIKSAVTGSYLQRMTLTYSAIAQSRRALLLITGEEKRTVFDEAMATPSSTYPVRQAIDALQNRLIVIYSP